MQLSRRSIIDVYSCELANFLPFPEHLTDPERSVGIEYTNRRHMPYSDVVASPVTYWHYAQLCKTRPTAGDRRQIRHIYPIENRVWLIVCGCAQYYCSLAAPTVRYQLFALWQSDIRPFNILIYSRFDHIAAKIMWMRDARTASLANHAINIHHKQWHAAWHGCGQCTNRAAQIYHQHRSAQKALCHFRITMWINGAPAPRARAYIYILKCYDIPGCVHCGKESRAI